MLYTIPEAAQQLRLSRNYAYGLVRSGRIATVQIGRRRLVAQEALDAFIEANTAGGEVAVNNLAETVARVLDSRERQGLPRQVEDSDALEHIATVLIGAQADRKLL